MDRLIGRQGEVEVAHVRRVAFGGAAVLAFTMAVAAAAWACIPVATLTMTPAMAKPGDTVTVTGKFYGTKSDVSFHRGAIDGPVLTSTTPDEDGNITATFKVPVDATAGSFLVVATQPVVPGSTTWGVPSRALVTVAPTGTTPIVGGEARPAENRPAALVQSSSVSMGTLLLTALGVVGVGLFLAGAGAVFMTRRATGAPQAVRSGR